MQTDIGNGTAQVLGGACFREIAKAPKCECSAECTEGVDSVTEQPCKDAIIKTMCENSAVIEDAAQIDIRGLFVRLLNDCSSLKATTCPAGVRSKSRTSLALTIMPVHQIHALIHILVQLHKNEWCLRRNSLLF
jgi:hypothetical protein